MHIFIDESGQFLPLDRTRSRAAAVVAVVVPSSQRTLFGKAFRAAKRDLGLGGKEIKGSTLAEAEAAKLLMVLQQHEVIVEAQVLDVGQHETSAVSMFKRAQAAKLLEHITRAHHPSLIRDLLSFQARIEQLPNQLFLQALCLWKLVPQIIETSTMFHSQRRPRELGSFVWRVDAKDNSITELEDLWTNLVGPIVSTRSVMTPMGMIPGGDYSFYERFDAEPPASAALEPGRRYTDMRRVLKEDFAFVDSHDDLGVQAADVVASALTRALNGSLRITGWLPLSSLFVRALPQTLRLIELQVDSDQARSRPVENRRWAAVANTIHQRARSMLTQRTRQLLRETDKAVEP